MQNKNLSQLWEKIATKCTTEEQRNEMLSLFEKADREDSMKIEKLTRFEVINHADNGYPIGRKFTLYKQSGDFSVLEFDYQDGGKTLKVFIN